MRGDRSGLWAAVGAFFLWGVLPLFWKQLEFLPPSVIVAQRTVWSLVLLVAIGLAVRERAVLAAALRSPRQVVWHLLSGLLLASNWLLYVWATLNGRILEGALGYYLNPFFNMLFGFCWFGERHGRRQQAAIALALAGVALQVPAVGSLPWVSLVLALTFSLYAVVKKQAPLPSRQGLTLETLLLAPLALGWLLHASRGGTAVMGTAPAQTLWVVASGAATTLPLVLFGHAARRISLTTLGILQFLGPTLQFGIGWWFYREPMTALRLASFALIWLAIALYATERRSGDRG